MLPTIAKIKVDNSNSKFKSKRVDGKKGMNKRRIESDEEQEYEKIFNRSKKIIRSPEQRKREEEARNKTEISEAVKVDKQSMEDIKQMIQEMMKQMDQNTKDLKQEIREIKLEMERKEATWGKEKKVLLDRIEKLENKYEVEEKQKKKKNLVIKGLKLAHNMEEDVKKLFSEQLQSQVEINNIHIRNKGKGNEIVIVEMTNWEQKQKIMAAKNKLKGTNIYIENELTWEERKIQWEIRSIAKEMRAAGKRVKIGYQKLISNGEVYVWEKNERGVVLKERENGEETSKND